jgi:hypothetical protein
MGDRISIDLTSHAESFRRWKTSRGRTAHSAIHHQLSVKNHSSPAAPHFETWFHALKPKQKLVSQWNGNGLHLFAAKNPDSGEILISIRTAERDRQVASGSPSKNRKK